MENTMAKNLPARPNLDHLRRQAKALLAALEAGEADAISTLVTHLPSAAGLTAQQVRERSFRLADAQSAVARKTGFGSWPQLARHVEQLRALEGTWTFASLEIDGSTMPASMLASSRILIDGDRFRTESPEATYEGIFNINVEAEPHEIDIEFVAGPEAGNRNFGIYRLAGDQLEICLDLNGKPRPREFRTAAGSGQAYERLARASQARPDNVTGGQAASGPAPPSATDARGFEFKPSATLTRLQGDWKAVKIIHNGQPLPAAMIATAVRSATQNELKVTVGGQLMIDALVRVDESTDPIAIDYCALGGPIKGTIQQGIIEWIGDDACFVMSPAGQPRPSDFSCPAGSGRILSQWRLKR
jgi:uncharacterized protein (TIGR03067 family)